MTGYIIKRLLSLIPVVIIVSSLVLIVLHLTPGDPASIMLGPDAPEEALQSLRERMGFDEPLPVQYYNWIKNIFQGDLGTSIFLRKPVTTAFFEHAGPTISLSIMAQALAIIIGIPLGITAATKRGTFIDQLVMGISLFGISIPSFLLGLFLMLIFGVSLGWLPIAGYRALDLGFWEHVRHLILPAVALAYIQSAFLARITRSSVLEVLNQDFVKVARAKGLKESTIIYKHVLRNAFIPILTVIGQSFGILLGGLAVIESVFNLPGVGRLIVSSILRRDYVVVQGSVLIIAGVYVMINLTVDLIYGLIDPRVRLGRTE